jgi:protein-tyrosine phosphatase
MSIKPDERILHLPSGHNFRDLGGYRTADGQSVKWRTIFRSGHMSSITGDDIAQLHALGIDTICDFRANGERKERPTLWHEESPTELWARDHEGSLGSLTGLMARPDVRDGETHQTMLDIYRNFPREQAENYREMFKRIAQGRVPLVFNCSAGKDRTGLAAALLLSLLGVPRDVIEADYLLTNDVMEGLAAFLAASPKYKDFITLRREKSLPLLRAESEYLEASFAVIEKEYGSVETYLSEALGITADEQKAIRANMLD